MSELRVEAAGPVLRLTIDREDRRNALSGQVLAGLLREVRAASAPDHPARVVVLAGAGQTVFCAGADLAQMVREATGLSQHEARAGLRELVLAMRACPRPVVARVHGLCLAGGMGLALGADLVVASSAARFGLPEVDLGLWPFMVSALLARHVSPKHAMDLMLSGERVDAAAAYRLGLVSRVIPADRFDADFEDLVAVLTAKPPVAVRLGKAAFQAAEQSALGPALEAMQAQLSLLSTSADAREGIAAFLHKRPPHWTGR